MESEGRAPGAPGFGALLRQQRLTARLSQEALAERARVSVEAISALERGFRRAPQRETLALLADALALDDEQRRAFEEAAAKAASPRRRPTGSVTVGPWPSSRAALLPPAVTTFAGREDELAALDCALAQPGSIAAVYGLGGVGKSAIAREYARRNRDRFSVTWWLNAQTEGGIIEGLISLGMSFIDGLDQHADRRIAARHVIEAIPSRFEKPALLVFDDLEEERHLRAWLPRSRVRTLVTSRNATWRPDVQAIHLTALPIATGAEYLRRESRRTEFSETEARAIAEALGSLPLALAHAAASLRNMRMLSPERYLKHIAAYLENAPADSEYPRSVFATFKTAISQAEHEAAGAAAALCFAASFATDAIPDELFRQPAEIYADGLRPTMTDSTDLHSLVADEVRLDAVLGALDRLSLLTYAEETQSYAMHSLVQLAARDLIRDTESAWHETAIVVADSAFPAVELTTWPQCARLLPHALAALDAIPGDAALLPAARIASRCAHYLLERGEYDAAETLQQRALKMLEKLLGQNHLEVASALNRLANLCVRQARFSQAEALHRRALSIREMALGSDHLDVSYILTNLGAVCYEQQRYDDAEGFQRRALAIKEKALGSDHSDVAGSLNNLGNIYADLERFEEAEAVTLRALRIWERSLGPDHPVVAMSLSNLGELYRKQERYDEAQSLFVRALAIVEKALGPHHPEVAAYICDCARACEAKGRYGDAARFYARALIIQEKALHPDHPATKEVRQKLTTLRAAD